MLFFAAASPSPAEMVVRGVRVSVDERGCGERLVKIFQNKKKIFCKRVNRL